MAVLSGRNPNPGSANRIARSVTLRETDGRALKAPRTAPFATGTPAHAHIIHYCGVR